MWKWRLSALWPLAYTVYALCLYVSILSIYVYMPGKVQKRREAAGLKSFPHSLSLRILVTLIQKCNDIVSQLAISLSSRHTTQRDTIRYDQSNNEAGKERGRHRPWKR